MGKNGIKRWGYAVNDTTRFIPLAISFEIQKSQLSSNKHSKYHNLCLIFFYFPHSIQRKDANQQIFTSVTGANIHNSIGNRSSLLQDFDSTQHKHDWPFEYDPIEQLIETSREATTLELQAPSSTITINSTLALPTKWNNYEKKAYQLDHSFILKKQLYDLMVHTATMLPSKLTSAYRSHLF